MLSDISYAYGGEVPFDRAGMLYGSTVYVHKKSIGIQWMCATEVGHTQQKSHEF